MDNIKMGTLIREARKKKGLTQKDLALQLNITDRAVSKWERGICAPDLSLLEPLSKILELSITELITGESPTNEPSTEKVETILKDTLLFSNQELIRNKKRTTKKVFIIVFLVVILTTLFITGILWYKGFFHIIGKYASPDNTTITTVYNCELGYNEPPIKNGFTLSDDGLFRGRTIYTDAVFDGLWWSPNGNYQAISILTDEGIWLILNDYTRNSSCNLTNRLELCLYENEFFSKVPYDEEGFREIDFEFIQWSNADPKLMLIYFSYTDNESVFHEGYMWYDYESGSSYGEIEVKQGDKTYWLNELWDTQY